MKNIDQTERQVLVGNKLREGMGIKQAAQEVERDIKHIRNLNLTKKRLEKEIKQIEKKKERVSKDFKKEFKKLQKSNEPDDKFTKKKTGSRSANTKYLNRIMYYLDEFPGANLTKIAKENCMTTVYVRDGLTFLLKHKLVEGTDESAPKYKLKDKKEVN